MVHGGGIKDIIKENTDCNYYIYFDWWIIQFRLLEDFQIIQEIRGRRAFYLGDKKEEIN